ncbi:N-acetyltransferase [Ligilactobacillus saerimneri]|uniref:GNAT family N-acetyltransferase n=1 Tax=Ligilactobacillus saerimneri TaxID=228229 RepID=UPI00294371DE|nr:N-acetyltransferase [Ligilactobacillus saerimneri]
MQPLTMKDFTIRTEKSADYPAVESLVYQAFLIAEQRDGTEQDLVRRLRQSTAFIPELSLVAEHDGSLVGYILLTEVTINGHKALALAPLAVAPAYQRQGIGTALIKRSHLIAQKLGYPCIIVLGSDTYYPRLGYQPAAKYGIKAPFEVPSKYYQVYPLVRNLTEISGTVAYAPEFDLN